MTNTLLKSLSFSSRFVGSQNRDRFFTNTDRIRVVNEILQNVTYGKRKRAEVGIDRLLEEDVFQAAYPLHDVRQSNVLGKCIKKCIKTHIFEFFLVFIFFFCVV